MKEKHKATNTKKWGIILALAILPIPLALFWNEETLLISHRIGIVVACVLLIVYAFYHAIYSSYMNCDGVYCMLLGKHYHNIQWDQVGTVVIVRDYKFNLRISGNTRIIVIPKDCPTDDLKNLGGVSYLAQYHRHVVWMDDTESNRAYINRVWGELRNCK